MPKTMFLTFTDGRSIWIVYEYEVIIAKPVRVGSNALEVLATSAKYLSGPCSFGDACRKVQNEESSAAAVGYLPKMG